MGEGLDYLNRKDKFEASVADIVLQNSKSKEDRLTEMERD